MDQQLERRIGEADVKIESCKTAIGNVKGSGDEKKRLSSRLKDLQGVRSGLVKQLPAKK